MVCFIWSGICNLRRPMIKMLFGIIPDGYTEIKSRNPNETTGKMPYHSLLDAGVGPRTIYQ